MRRHIVAKCVLECFRGVEGDSPVSKIHRVLLILDKFGTAELNRNLLTKHNCNMRFGNFETSTDQTAFLDELKTHIKDNVMMPHYVGKPFDFDDLEECLDLAILYEEAHGNRQIRDYCSQMLTRFKWIREREDFNFLRASQESLREEEKNENFFVEYFIGLDRKNENLFKTAQVIILDMNEAADELVEVTAAVMARLVFDRLRRAEPRNRLPVHLILEEAHRYVAERPSRYAIDASRIFERIAKEGRKYGAFLIVASQRPSELSKTVLSQCSNFMVHRIQNPDDLVHIRQMTPFISESVLKRLPSLPKQHALIFGNAVNLPTTFRVRDVHPRPKSDDAEIRELWFKESGKPVELLPPRLPQSDPPPPEAPEVDSDGAGARDLDDEIPF